MIESKKISTKLLKVKNIPKPKSENFQGSLNLKVKIFKEIFVFKKVSENKNKTKTNFLINLLFQIFSCYFIIIIVFKSENPSTT